MGTPITQWGGNSIIEEIHTYIINKTKLGQPPHILIRLLGAGNPCDLGISGEVAHISPFRVVLRRCGYILIKRSTFYATREKIKSEKQDQSTTRGGVTALNLQKRYTLPPIGGVRGVELDPYRPSCFPSFYGKSGAP